MYLLSLAGLLLGNKFSKSIFLLFTAFSRQFAVWDFEVILMAEMCSFINVVLVPFSPCPTFWAAQEANNIVQMTKEGMRATWQST